MYLFIYNCAICADTHILFVLVSFLPSPLPSHGAGLKIRKFQSGVMVLQASTFDEERMCSKLAELAEETVKDGISISEASQRLHVSLLVAKEQILLAEHKEFLCRDDTINGLFFFPNKFK
jgi:ESCRT-II complex subunit VPS36